MEPFAVTSPAFEPGALIPEKYTCDGEQVSPPLRFAGIPGGTQSLALIMDDPDIPAAVKEERNIDVFDHWVVFNISPDTTDVTEGEQFGTLGLNGAQSPAYIGPCPPPQFEPKEHRYIFTLYALKDLVSFATVPTKKEVLEALEPLMIAKAELIGRYARK
ncbi:MAG TPA: YbhB/YbcL family Raf kinase inhibitor-like protein [Candidatus Paceibacterota bacterium]|nr:YbhB/YbcL family Raf kinase inhibitor-like protein [Candidatus Paceibacterota bacterium]